MHTVQVIEELEKYEVVVTKNGAVCLRKKKNTNDNSTQRQSELKDMDGDR